MLGLVIYALTGTGVLYLTSLLPKTSELRKYDCSILTNLAYSGWNLGPKLDKHGLLNIKDLKHGQMRVLRPRSTIGGCAHGGDYNFLVRRGHLENVVIEFQGGGACWSYKTCTDPDNLEYTDLRILDMKIPYVGFSALDCAVWNIYHSYYIDGLFDPSTSNNPVSDWSYILVTYCTKDIHIGNSTRTYYPEDDASAKSLPITFRHQGQHNTDVVLDWVKQQFSNPDKVLITGCSAGALAAGIHGTSLSRYYAQNSPETNVTIVADGFMMLSTDSFVREGILSWGLGASCTLWELAKKGGALAEDATTSIQDYGLNVWQGITRYVADYGGATILISSLFDTVQRHFLRMMHPEEGGIGLNLNQVGLRILNRVDIADSAFIFSGEKHCETALSIALDSSELTSREYSSMKAYLEMLFAGEILPPPYVSEDCADIYGCDGILGSGVLEDQCGQCLITHDIYACMRLDPEWIERCSRAK